jgi:hypothetical protein
MSYIHSNASCLHEVRDILFFLVVNGEDEGVEERMYGVVNERKT